MPDEMMPQDQGAPAMAPRMAPPMMPPPAGMGNQDIRAGPVSTAIPTLYSPNQNKGQGSPSFDSASFAAEAFQRLPLDVALKAMEGAVQLEGTLGYAADIKAGVPDNVALAHWAPKLWYRHPAQVHAAMQANKPAFQPEEITLASGQQVTRMSPQRVAFSPKGQRTDLTPGEQIHSITAEMKALENQVKMGLLNPQQEAGVWRKHSALTDQLAQLRSKGHKAPDTVRVKDKTTGIIHLYPAHRKDEVPKDDYEVLGQ